MRAARRIMTAAGLALAVACVAGPVDARLSAAASSPPRAPLDQLEPALSSDGTNYLAVWRDDRSGEADLYASRVSPTGVVLDRGGIPISTAPSVQHSPAVAFDGTNYFVVWQDARADGWNVYGARVTPAGTVLDPSGIPISTAVGPQTGPSLAFDGTNYFVTWSDRRSLYTHLHGARVTPAGTVLDPDGIALVTIEQFQLAPAMAFDGTNYLLAWDDIRPPYYLYDVYGTRLSPAGTVLDPSGIPISATGHQQRAASVAFDGVNYAVVWDDDRSSDWDHDVYAARVSTAGTVLDPGGIPISVRTRDQGSPALDFGDGNYLVAWADGRAGENDIFGARLTPAGGVLDPAGIPISEAAADQAQPALAFGGTNHLVAWADRRSGNDYDIYGTRVSPGGVVLDPAGIPISRGAAPRLCDRSC